MFEHLTGLMSISGSRRCTRKATPILPHAINHAAVAECKSERGLTVYLCVSCTSYVHAEAWLLKMGAISPSASAIRTAARLLNASAGYEPPCAAEHRAKEEWHHLRDFEKKTLARRIKREVLGPQNEVQAIKILFVARDACPDPKCLQRGGKHSTSCGLTYGEAFAERAKVEVG